jgi:hypothetical protein
MHGYDRLERAFVESAIDREPYRLYACLRLGAPYGETITKRR